MNYGSPQLNVQGSYARSETEIETKPILGRKKRSLIDDKTSQNEETLSTQNSNISDTTISTNIYNAAANEGEKQATMDLEVVKNGQHIDQDQREPVVQLEDYIPPMTPEGRKKKKKPSKGTLLAAGLLGAAAGYALLKPGINSYYNRPPQYAAPYPPSLPYSTYPSIGYPPNRPTYINNYPARPPVSPNSPSYINHYPARPPVSHYY